jgi:hypothetical protein
VLFRVVSDDGTADTETLWAQKLDGDNYRLDNSPFYAYSVSWEDVIYAPFDDNEQLPTFERVVEKSGNRTVRVIFDPPVEPGNASEDVLQGLVNLGCSFEGANPGYIAINIPPGVDLMAVKDYLIEREATWEYADPRYSELLPENE